MLFRSPNTDSDALIEFFLLFFMFRCPVSFLSGGCHCNITSYSPVIISVEKSETDAGHETTQES